MGKSLKEAKKLKRERDDQRLGTNPELRKLDRILCDESEVRNKERKLLGKVVSSKVIKRGGLSKERNKEIQALFKKGKPLPYLGKDMVAEKALREAAVKELQEALQKIEEARAAGVTTYVKGQEAPPPLQMEEIKLALPQTTPTEEQPEQTEKINKEKAVQAKWEGIALPLR